MFFPLILTSLATAVGAAIFSSDKNEETESPHKKDSNGNISQKKNKPIYISINAKKAIESIISSIKNENDTFFYELRRSIILLRREYHDVNSIMDAILFYIEKPNLYNIHKQEIEKIKANQLLLREYINLFLIESYDEKLRIYLTSKSESMVAYKEALDRIFCTLESPNQIETYDELLGKAGDIYNNLIELYDSLGFISNKNVLHHGLVFDMANLILEKHQFYFCRGLDRNQFAEDIMNGIIHHIHNGLSNNDENKDDKGFVESLFNRYLGNRKIKSYYYFLKMGTRILEALETQYGLLCDKKDFEKRFSKQIINKIMELDYSFFMQMDSKIIYNEMIQYYKATKHRS